MGAERRGRRWRLAPGLSGAGLSGAGLSGAVLSAAMLCGAGSAQATPPAEVAPPEPAPAEVAPAEATPAEAVPAAGPPARCTYRTFSWSVKLKKAVGHREVDKPYAEVTADERDPADPRCTVCREDQVAVAVAGLPEVSVCKHWAPQVQAALTEIQRGGEFRIERLEGYRPGRSRGAVVDGLRSEWSNHAFGTALDVNAHHNAIYSQCKLAGPATGAADIARCKRGLGGPWDPAKRPKLTISAGNPAHRAFTAFWKWGGALPGSTKDFMHFSITGE